jgi:DNA polymerase III delta subunit
MNRIDQLILNRYPDQLDQIKTKIELLKLDYDEDQFDEEDILESILMELDII